MDPSAGRAATGGGGGGPANVSLTRSALASFSSGRRAVCGRLLPSPAMERGHGAWRGADRGLGKEAYYCVR